MLKVDRHEIMAGERSYDINIPLDIIVEILKKLPAKSVARFRCVSKGWESLIVVDSIVTRSLTQPPRDPHFIYCTFVRLTLFKPIYAREYTPPFAFYAYPNQIKDKEQHLYHMDFFGDCDDSLKRFQYVRGLIVFWCQRYGTFIIHNPTTKQSVSLPSTEYKPRFYLFGYDPLGNVYKVVCLTIHEMFFQVFTLGDPNKLWTTIQCGIGFHFLFGHPVCINGTIYYNGSTLDQRHVLVSLDVRSLKFNHVQAPDEEILNRHDTCLVNNHGKLGCISRNNLTNEDVDVWVMENDEKQEWSFFFGQDITFIPLKRCHPKSD